MWSLRDLRKPLHWTCIAFACELGFQILKSPNHLRDLQSIIGRDNTWVDPMVRICLQVQTWKRRHYGHIPLLWPTYEKLWSIDVWYSRWRWHIHPYCLYATFWRSPVQIIRDSAYLMKGTSFLIANNLESNTNIHIMNR